MMAMARVAQKLAAVRARLAGAVTLLLVALPAMTSPASAINPSERLSDAKLESRARELSAELRCLVCQNQSIDDSDAPLAKDLRLLVRERLVQGDSNSQVKDFVVARYGEFVLLKPPFGMHTLLLWLTPLLVLGIIVTFVMRAITVRRAAGVATSAPVLSPAEEERLRELLAGDASKASGQS